MKIEIEVKQIIVRGEKKLRIDRVCAIRHENLPAVYTQSSKDPVVYQDGKSLCLKNIFAFSYSISPGDIISEERWAEIDAYISKCGKRLSEINDRLRKENDGWNKIIVFKY